MASGFVEEVSLFLALYSAPEDKIPVTVYVHTYGKTLLHGV